MTTHNFAASLYHILIGYDGGYWAVPPRRGRGLVFGKLRLEWTWGDQL